MPFISSFFFPAVESNIFFSYLLSCNKSKLAKVFGPGIILHNKLHCIAIFTDGHFFSPVLWFEARHSMVTNAGTACLPVF